MNSTTNLQKRALILRGEEKNPADSVVVLKEPKNVNFSNLNFEQSFRNEGSPKTISENSKKSSQSNPKNSYVDSIHLGDALDEQMINDIKQNKQKKNLKLNFSDIFFKIKFKSMARRLLNSTRSFMYKNLSIRQFKQIDDRAWSFDKNDLKIASSKINNVLIKAGLRQSISAILHSKTIVRKNIKKEGISKILSFFSSISIIQGLMKSFDRRFPVIDPISIQKIIWDFINIILILVYTFQIPLFVTFPEKKSDEAHWAMIISVPIFLFIDLLYTLNTGSYQKGALIKKRLTLINLNLKKRIIPSLLIIVLYLVYILVFRSYNYESSNLNRWFDILLVPLFQKLSDIGFIVNKLEEHQTLSKKRRNIIALIKLILQIVYIGHFISCFWVVIAQYQNYYGIKTWVKFTVFSDALWYQLYIEAYYFTTVTMITVGYGDIIPVTFIEKMICIILMIFSCGVFAYSMNTVGSILESLNEESVKLKQNMQIINSYMQRKNVGKQTRNQIREYLYYYWKEEKERDQEGEDKIINILSDNLKKNLLMESKNVVLKKSAIFRNNFSDEVKEKIVPLIREYRCYPEEIICLEGVLDDCSIYFIEKGSVEVFIEQKDNSQSTIRPISTIGKGQCFGETSFFTGKLRSASVRSREFTTLLILNREEFLQILVNHQQDYEKFCVLKDSLLFYENYQLINVQCLSCQSYGHQIVKCPYIHYTPNYSILRESFMRSPFQERNSANSCRSQNKSNAVYNVNVVFEKAEEYNRNNSNSSDSIEYQYLCQFYEEIQMQYQGNEDDLKQSRQSDGKSHFDPNGMNQAYDRKESSDCSDSIQGDDDSQNFKVQSQKDLTKNFDEEDEDKFYTNQVSKEKFKLIDQLYVINEICNSPLLNENGAIKKRSPQFFVENINQNQQEKLRKTHRFSSFLEKQQTSDSLDRRANGKKATVLSNISNTSGDKRSTAINTNYFNSNNANSYLESNSNQVKKKQTIIPSQQNFQIYRQKTRKITNAIPQKNNEAFKKFIGRGNQTDDILTKIPGLIESTKKAAKKERQMTISQNLIQKNPQNNIMCPPNPSPPQPIDYKRGYSKLNSTELKMSSSVSNNLKEEQKSKLELFASVLQNQDEEEQDSVEEVEDHFDCMQNFTYYFPLNNYSYQHQLFQMNQSERKQIMLRAYYDNMNNMKQVNSSKSSLNQKNKKLSTAFASKLTNNLGTQSDSIIALDQDPKEKHFDRRKSKFFTNQKTLMALQINKNYTSERFDKGEKRDKSDTLLFSSNQSIPSFQNKQMQYRFSVNKKQLEFNKGSSLQNKPTNCTITDIHYNIIDNGNSSLIGNLLLKEKDHEPQQSFMFKQITSDIQEKSIMQRTEGNQQKDETSISKDMIRLQINNEDEDEVISCGTFSNTQNIMNIQNNNNNMNTSFFNEQPNLSNNNLVTFENSNLSKRKYNKRKQSEKINFENSFQEYDFNKSNIQEEFDDIASDIEYSKRSIKQSNFYVTQKKRNSQIQ